MPFPHDLARKVWNRHGAGGRLAWLICLPLSAGFRAAVGVRNRLYAADVLPCTRVAAAVVSVGNLTVGGTGKTPFVLWLARALRAHGHRVAIVSRGHAGRARGVTLVGAGGRVEAGPDEVGDEAVMVARRFSGAVVVGRDRVAAAQQAIQAHRVDVVLLDDGFQHRRLARDLDIVLVNAAPGSSSTSLLPAGPFREPHTAVRRADVVILTKAGSPEAARAAAARYAFGKPCFFADPAPVGLIAVTPDGWDERPLAFLTGKRVLAVSGVADPATFYRLVGDSGADVAEVMEFPDHHVYTRQDWHTIAAAGRTYDLVVTTEKDLVKLDRFPFARQTLVALRIDMAVAEADRLLRLIEDRLPPAPA